MNEKTTSRMQLTARIVFRRSAGSYSRTRAVSSSTFAMSTLLFHVPDDEDETELAHRDHEPDDHVEQEDDEPRARLADQGHDRHDDHEEKGFVVLLLYVED